MPQDNRKLHWGRPYELNPTLPAHPRCWLLGLVACGVPQLGRRMRVFMPFAAGRVKEITCKNCLKILEKEIKA